MVRNDDFLRGQTSLTSQFSSPLNSKLRHHWTVNIGGNVDYFHCHFIFYLSYNYELPWLKILMVEYFVMKSSTIEEIHVKRGTNTTKIQTLFFCTGDRNQAHLEIAQNYYLTLKYWGWGPYGHNLKFFAYFSFLLLSRAFFPPLIFVIVTLMIAVLWAKTKSQQTHRLPTN